MERRITSKYIGVMLAVILIFSGLFYIIARHVKSSDIISFDDTIIHFTQSFISDELTIWVERITFLGSILFIAAAILIITVLLLWKKKYALAIFYFC